MVIQNGIYDLSIDDFVLVDNLSSSDMNVYYINRDCFIFNKLYGATDRCEKGAITVQTHKQLRLSEYIQAINEYIKWLNSDECKHEVINNFCDFVNNYSDKTISVKEIIENNWYEKLEIISITITIPTKCEKMNICIVCADNWHILYIEIVDNKVISIGDEYVDIESGLAYDGIWLKNKCII
jgi:hypothetical protein